MRGLAVLLVLLLCWAPSQVQGAPEEPCRLSAEELQGFDKAVQRLLDAGIFRSRPSSEPHELMYQDATRAWAGAVLSRMLWGWDALPESRAPFSDMAGHWAEREVAALVREGLLLGNPDGRFRPDDPITPDELKLLLGRLLRLGPDLTLANADKALRRGGVETALPCALPRSVTLAQVTILLDRVLTVPYYARFQWSELRIRREFAAGVVYQSGDGARIEAPSWAQIAARLGSGHELVDAAATLTAADGSYIKAWGGPRSYQVEVGLYTDGALRQFRAAGSEVPERGYTTIDGTTVYLLDRGQIPDYVVPSLFRSFMEEESPPGGIRWIEVAALSDSAAENAPFCIMSPAEVALAQLAVDRLAKARVIREAYTINPASAEVSMSRAEFAAMLRRGLGLPGQPPPGQAPFADMESHWASSEVALLVQEGIVTGDPDGRFRPDDPVTLNEVKLLLARALRLGADLRLESADEALRSGGVDTTVPCGEMPHATQYQALILLDRAMEDDRQSMQ